MRQIATALAICQFDKIGSLTHPVLHSSCADGRAVLHRDIKPTNCILESTQARVQDGYDWNKDNAIWSNGPDAEAAVAANKWKLVVIDFGFARALTRHELESQKAPMRQSILKEIENKSFADIAKLVAEETHNESLSKKNADSIRRASFFQERVEHPEITSSKRRLTTYSSGISQKALDTLNEDDDGMTNVDGNQKKEHKPVRKPRSFGRLQNPLRQSTTRTKLRSMSALGTKAYAAPEIKNDLRNKTQDDVDYQYQALTKCVADYGMIGTSMICRYWDLCCPALPYSHTFTSVPRILL
jgi:serine/threonine protein kinase